MKRCQYVASYHDLYTHRESKFECQEEVLGTGEVCIFHNEIVWKSDPQQVRRRLYDKFNRHINDSQNNEPLNCIGYNIPDIEIDGRQFPNTIFFSKAIFHGGAVFKNVNFQAADFTDAQFQYAYFKNVNFQAADFTDAQFQYAYFNNSVFESATFTGSKAYQGAEFNVVGFRHDTKFRESYFKELSFVNVEFGSDAEADFQFAKFDKINLRKVTFIGKSYFRYVEFRDEIFVKESEFHNRTYFSNSKFLGSANFIDVKFNAETEFSHGLFQDQENVVFDVESLSKVSFFGVDITRVRFSERVVWGETENEFKILDERRLEQCVYPLFSWTKISKKEQESIRHLLMSELNLEWIHTSKIERDSNKNILTITSVGSNDKLSIELVEEQNMALISLIGSWSRL